MSTLEIPQPPSNVLGVDGTTPQTPVEESPAEETTSSPGGSEPSTPSLTQEQISSLQEKAQLYDLIDKEPQLIDYIEKYFKQATRDEPESSTSNNQSTPSSVDYVSRKEYNQLKALAQNLTGQVQIMQFAATHPDFGNYRESMGKLINTHPTLTLQEAYDISKSRSTVSNPSRPSRPSANLKQSEVESRPSHVERTGLDAAREKIQDPKAAPSMKEALRIAWNAALAEEQGNE